MCPDPHRGQRHSFFGPLAECGCCGLFSDGCFNGPMVKLVQQTGKRFRMRSALSRAIAPPRFSQFKFGATPPIFRADRAILPSLTGTSHADQGSHRHRTRGVRSPPVAERSLRILRVTGSSPGGICVHLPLVRSGLSLTRFVTGGALRHHNDNLRNLRAPINHPWG